MANLADDDLLLVQRTSAGISTNYSITGSALKEDLGGPDGLIVPPVSVLTPLNGAGLDDGQSYTPMSSAYVSTDTTPIYHRNFPERITTISGGSWVNENSIFDGSTDPYAELQGATGVVSQVVFTPHAGWFEGETYIWAYASGGGTIEILDDTDTVLRTYTLLTSSGGNTAVGIVRADQKIRFTTSNQNESLYIANINRGPIDAEVTGRVKFEFTDDTDLDKMVAPIIQTDENGNVKTPTTSTVDSTTSIPGDHKILVQTWYNNNNQQRWLNDSAYPIDQRTPPGSRMTWVKSAKNSTSCIISDNVVNYGNYLRTSATSYALAGGPQLDENESTYPVASAWNPGQASYNSQYHTYITEIGVAPKVLDIVTWTGNGSSVREIPHNLGTKPGMIIVKTTDGVDRWRVWHQDLTSMIRDGYINLDTDNYAGFSSSTVFASEPTKDAFYVGSELSVNGDGYTFVAYVFAADTPGKIKCGIYEGNGANQFVYPGFAPGFVMIKRIDGNSDWIATNKKSADEYKYWYPNRTEYGLVGNNGAYIGLSNNYFVANSGHTDWNTNWGDYIYIAVAADLTGPSSTQLNFQSGQDLEFFTTGTQITSNAAASGSNISFETESYGGNGSTLNITPGFGNDRWWDSSVSTGNKWFLWIKGTTISYDHYMVDSERDPNLYLSSNKADAEQRSTYAYKGDYNNIGYTLGNDGKVNNLSDSYLAWEFHAAPQFFDIQKYVGNGSGGKTISHDLGVEPGCIITKSLDNDTSWIVYHSDYPDSLLQLNSTSAAQDSPGSYYASVDENSYTVGWASPINSNDSAYISYIFAKDTPYVKCGTYTGAGYGTQVNVGFQPRWIMLKNASNGVHGSWVIFDEKLNNKATYVNMNNQSQNFNFSFDSTGIQLNGSFTSIVGSGDEFIYVAIAKNSHPPSAPSSSTVLETPDPNTAQMVVSAQSFDTGATASAPALEASITQIAGADGNELIVDAFTGTWMPGLYAKGTETTINAPGPDEITFTSQNQGTPAFSGVDATLASRTWTLESGASATGPWTVVDSYVDYDILSSQTGATPWTSSKPNLTPNTFYRVKVQYNSTNAESVESVYNTFKTGDA